MAQPSPYFDSVSRSIDDSKAALLKAVADGGTAGKQAFDAAAATAAQSKTDAVARAANRSALYGVGGNNETFLSAHDARMNQHDVNRTNFESGLAQTQASGESYLEKARASIPVLQAENINKGAELDTRIKMAIEAAKAKAQADADKENRAIQRTLDAENRADARAIGRENRTVARESAKSAAKGPDISLDALLGAATQHAGAPARPLPKGATTEDRNQNATDEINRQLAGFGDQGKLTDLAASIGRTVGVPESKLAELYAPGKQSTLGKNLSPAEQTDTTAKALATKYDTKGVTYETAKSVLGNVDFKGFVSWILGGALDGDGNPLSRSDVHDSIYEKFIKQDNRNWTAEYHILVGEYLPRIPE